MKLQKPQIDKMEQTVIAAHRNKADISISSTWQFGVMQEVRRLSETMSVTNIFQPAIMIWRFAYVTASVALLFLVCSVSLGLTPDYGLAYAWLLDPSGSLTAGLLGN